MREPAEGGREARKDLIYMAVILAVPSSTTTATASKGAVHRKTRTVTEHIPSFQWLRFLCLPRSDKTEFIESLVD